MTDIENLLAIMARLRDPDTGCPWDLKQSFASIVPHTIEEAYEVGQAIEDDDMAALADELGDLLFQIVFYARMAEENGDFDFNAVVRQISEKMVRRHPHVFADANIASADTQTRSWEALKAEERQQKAAARGKTDEGALAGVARALPALARAVKLQRRAARVGFDWPDLRPVLAKLREELDELEAELDSDGAAPERLADEVGDVRGARALGGRSRRRAVRLRQYRPPRRHRRGGRAQSVQRQIRAPLCPHRSLARRSRTNPGSGEPRGNGRAMGPCESRRSLIVRQ